MLPAVFKHANNFFLNNFKPVYHEQGWSASLKQVGKFPELLAVFIGGRTLYCSFYYC